jgi:hypothetical protein
MTQTEFNKNELFLNLIKQTKERELGYRFILDEFKRNKWNINLIQAEKISIELDVNMFLILLYAQDINILNVDSKTKKIIEKQRKNKEKYTVEE